MREITVRETHNGFILTLSPLKVEESTNTSGECRRTYQEFICRNKSELIKEIRNFLEDRLVFTKKEKQPQVSSETPEEK